jgi:hypothetical protein
MAPRPQQGRVDDVIIDDPAVRQRQTLEQAAPERGRPVEQHHDGAPEGAPADEHAQNERQSGQRELPHVEDVDEGVAGHGDEHLPEGAPLRDGVGQVAHRRPVVLQVRSR